MLQRFYYLRQFAPALLDSLVFQEEEAGSKSLVQATRLLRAMNQADKRKLPEDAPLGFIPKNLRPFVEKDGVVDKQAWECALLTAIRDEIRAGNVSIGQSKRFGRFDDFFIADSRWDLQREGFFNRADLPVNAEEVPDYLTQRLHQAFDRFLE